VLHALQAVRGLTKGRTEARETEPVRPVDPERVEAVLPFLRATVAAMVRLQRLTGMRPGEGGGLRAGEVDRSGAVWVYRPARHKTQWRGKERVICIGSNGRAVLAPWLVGVGPDDFAFSPARDRERRYAEMRAGRRTKVQPSQLCRKKRRPKRQSGEHYTAESYAHAVAKACDKAFPPPGHLRPKRLESGKTGTARQV